MREPANLHFFIGREESTWNGIRYSDVPNLAGTILPSLVIGPSPRIKNTKPIKWAKVISPKLDDRPAFAGDKIVRGSIVKEADEHVIVSHHDEQANYVLVRTGLKVIDGSTANDWMQLMADGVQPKTHGSYSFDNGSVQIAFANDEEKLKQALTDPNVGGMGKVAAERLDAKAVGRRIPLLGCPQSSYVLWRMPFGAVLLVRDINGKLSRIVSHKDGVRRVDADKYDVFFEELEDAYQKKRLELTPVSASN